ncbi:MAG TPA: universal stress protein, partial [Gemmatimonadales bacterium]|nr:universal stress protein [Gemmatimonadales bacterium]
MYERILVPLENGPADAAILKHVSQLAKVLGSEVLLFHVADGWAARNMEQLNLRESQEIKEDRAYLERMSQELRQAGVRVDALLAAGDPAKEIAAAAEREQVDLI